MPAFQGELARERARVERERLARARRRAGVVKPPKPARDSRTVSTVRAETAERERSRRDFPTPQSMASPAGIRRLKQVAAEKPTGIFADIDARNRRLKPSASRHRETADMITKQVFGYGLGAAAAVPSPFSLPLAAASSAFLLQDPSTRRGMKNAQAAIANPGTSRKEKLKAAAELAVMTGGAGGSFGGVGKGARAARKAAAAAKKAARPAGAEKIIEALPEARRVRAQQEKGYTVERGKRGSAAATAYERAGGGQAGQQAAKAELKGELTKLSFGRLAKEFGGADSEMRTVLQPQVDALLDSITAHPSMKGRPLAAVGARDALTKAMDGVTPQKAEIRTLEAIFGEEAAQYFKWRAAKERALKVANIPRSLQASYDLSLNLRQLLVSGTRHPVLLKRAFQTQLKAARSPAASRAILDEIRERPRYDQMLDDGVKLTEVRGRPGVLEEDFIGAEYAERIPIVGAGVRVSQRAFTAGGAKMRADLYDLFMDQAEKASKTLTKKERQALASVINAGTGRGGMGLDVLEKAAPLGTVLLFSPRLIASRLAFFNPIWYGKLVLAGGPAAKEATTSLLSVLALGSSVLWLAKQLGAEVEDDPRSADFGKIQVGDTRVDIWGGFQQYAVNGYRYYKSETKGPDGAVTDKTREEILWNFASGKAAPLPGLARDLQRGHTFDRQPIDASLAGAPYGRAVGKLFVPFGIQNTWDAKDDPKLAAASFGLGAIGLGIQTYGAEPSKGTKSKSLRGGSGGKSKSLRAGRKKSKSLRSR